MQSIIKKEDEIKKEIKEEVEDLPEEKKKEKKTKKEKKENKKAKKNKQPVGPMHFTANNEPRAIDILGGLDPSVFNEVNIIFFTNLYIFLVSSITIISSTCVLCLV